jgi:hypothetical protein
MKKFFILLSIFISSIANAQSVTDNALDLDTDIIAASSCSGAVFAVAMWNFEYGVLSEDRARAMLQSSSLAVFLRGIKHQSIEHLQQYGSEYDEFFEEAFSGTYDDLVDGSFTWESQEEVDRCTARIMNSILSVSKSDLANAGIDDYFQFKDIQKHEADRRFDYMLELLESFQ